VRALGKTSKRGTFAGKRDIKPTNAVMNTNIITMHSILASPCERGLVRLKNNACFQARSLLVIAASTFLILAAPARAPAQQSTQNSRPVRQPQPMAMPTRAPAQQVTPPQQRQPDDSSAQQSTPPQTSEGSQSSPTFKREIQDEVDRVQGFDIEFYKKLNPDDFSATDVPALRKLFAGIYKQGRGDDYRTFKLTVTEEPRQRPFEDLNAEEGAKGGTWYTGARWRVNLHEDGLNDYLTVIVPKMQAVLSKVAMKTSENDFMYMVKTSGSNRLILEAESRTAMTLPDGVNICLEIPGTPEKLLNPKVGDSIPVKAIWYTLPKAFGSVIPFQAHDTGIGFYQHIYAKDGTYIGTYVEWNGQRSSYTDSVNAGATYSEGGVAAGFRGSYLILTCPSLGNILLNNGKSINVIQAEGQFPTLRFETDNYGGCLVSFRKAWDIFPGVKNPEKSNDPRKSRTTR